MPDKECSFDDILNLIRKEYKKVSDVKVFYTFKKMGFKHFIHERTVKTMCYCMAIQNIGLRINSSLLGCLREIDNMRALSVLHMLGDKKCLTLIRSQKKYFLEWIVSPEFIKCYEGKENEEKGTVPEPK